MVRPILSLITVIFLMVCPASADEQVFGGVGLQVVPTINGNLVVLTVLDGAPAAEKGMLPGDLIYQVDDFVLLGSDFGKVVSEHLWGVVGSQVTLHFRRPGVDGEMQLEIVRTVFEPRLTVTPSVQGRTADSKDEKK